MLARVHSACLTGIEAALVAVEVDVTHGLPSFTTVGLSVGRIKALFSTLPPSPASCPSRRQVLWPVRSMARC